LQRKNASDWDKRTAFFKGYAEDGWNKPGADAVMYVHSAIEYLAPWLNNIGFNFFKETHGPLSFEAVDVQVGTSRKYDGVNPFGAFPHRWSNYSTMNIAGHTISAADIPGTHISCFEAWDHWSDTALALDNSANILNNGMYFGWWYIDPTEGGWSAGQGLGLNANLKNCKLAFWNSCCNLFSPNRGLSTGGWPLVLTGLGFANEDDEINALAGASNQVAWGDTTYRLYIEKLDGTVVETLIPTPPSNHFSIDTNSQITIPSMPALPVGVYQIRIRKRVTGTDIYSYAGDWRTDADGRMTPGNRLYIWIYDTYTPPRIPIVITRWKWKKGDQTVFKYYAPIDIRSQATFWEGMILDLSAPTRGIGGDTHLPLFPDMSLNMDNSTREFSKLLAEYWVKNQLVEVYVGWQEEPASFASMIYRGIVTDYDRPGSTWQVRLRDVLEKYFAVRIPKYRCTVEDYPNIHQNHIGREMPEVLGLATLTAGSNPGAVEAIYVDTSAFKYLAARGSLKSIIEVYADGALVAAANYTVSYEDGGRTYITFTSDQEDAKITFNCQGYTYEDWDSANGYVQNPAYVILFLLAFFAEIPDIHVDIPAFDTLAATYTALGFGESGYLVLQDSKSAADYLQELLFTCGAYHWILGGGKITIGRKDVTSFAASLTFFQQIDALEEARKPSGFDKAVNTAVVQWGYFPTCSQFLGTKKVTRDTSIAAFETEMEPQSAWNFPWTLDSGLVDLRVTENLLRLGFGDMTISFPVSIEHLSTLDIFENFKFQDPYGIDRLGIGDVGRLFYIEKLTPDPLRGRVTIDGADLQWLLRQYGVMGDEADQPPAWASATEEDRLYLYLCDEGTGLLPDGEPGKTLIDENLGG
jgi:hypothetical protein